MKGKYITTQILLACLSKPAAAKKDIHAQLQETIAERRNILEQWEKLWLKEQSHQLRVVRAEEKSGLQTNMEPKQIEETPLSAA